MKEQVIYNKFSFLRMLVILTFLFPLNTFSFEIVKDWTNIDKGLELAKYKISRYPSLGDSTILVVRIDSQYWQFHYLSSERDAEGETLSIREWSNRFDLMLAVNATSLPAKGTLLGMGQGLIIDHHHIGSAYVNPDQFSAITFNPKREELPNFKIYDLDETEIDVVIEDYHTVIQNLRFMKRNRLNLWPERTERQSEVAIGEDSEGRLLIIFSRAAFTKHQFIDLMLRLPIDIVCTSHLESGIQAQLFIRPILLHLVGGYDSNITEGFGNITSVPVSNVLGISRIKMDAP